MPPINPDGSYTAPYTSPPDPVSPQAGPAKKKGWQATGTLTTHDTVKSVSMQADFSDPGSYTVQFQIVPPGLDNAGAAFAGIFSAVAFIDWTVEGGATVRRKVDVGNGVSVSGTAQAVRVQMNDNTDPAFNETAADYTVSVQVTKGTRPSQNKPPTLQGFQTTHLAAHGGAAVSIPVPQGVGVISAKVVVGTLAGTGLVNNATVTVQDVTARVIEMWNPSNNDFVPIPATGTTLFINNLDAANDYQCQVFWGIDG